MRRRTVASLTIFCLSTLNFDTTTDGRHSGTSFKFILPFQQTKAEIDRTARKA